MTRDEVIQVFRDWDGCFIGHRSDDVNEALNMAIKALEQEPCEDVISRQAVLDVIEREQFKGDAISEIEKLSPVKSQEPKSEWEHDHEILKAYSDGASEVLDKIRAEIEAEPYVSKMEVLDILDKYTAESAHDVAQEIVNNNGVVEL